MHGTGFPRQLDETIRLIHDIQSLGATDSEGRTALMGAIDFDDFDVVEAILRAEPNLASTPFCSPQDESLFTYPIHFSCQISARRDNPESRNTPMLISRHTHDLDSSHTPSRDHAGRTPLHLAVTGSLPTIARWILEKRTGLMHVADDHDRTPLHYCASASNADLLLEAGAVVDHTDKQGLTAMHRACLLGNTELVECLLKRKPQLDLKNNLYGTPLHCAIIHGSLGIVKALIVSGVSIDATDPKTNTALHVAARLHRHAILRLLIQNQANVDLLNSNGRSATDIALSEPQLGNIGTLTILHGSSKLDGGNSDALGVDGDEIDAAGSQRDGEYITGPDFSWDKTSLPTYESNNLVLPAQRSDGMAEQEETYDKKLERMESMDQIISSVVKDHLSDVSYQGWALSEMVSLVSVFFDTSIWQPSLSKRILEIAARVALDFAAILHSSYEEARCLRRRAKAWAGFLAERNGVTLALRLEAIRQYPKGKRPFSRVQQPPIKFDGSKSSNYTLYGVSKDLLPVQDRLEAVWKYMEENDPAGIIEDSDAMLEYERTGRNARLADGLSRKSISLRTLLSYMEYKFPVEKRHRPWNECRIAPKAAVDVDLGDLVLLDAGNLLPSNSDDDGPTDEKTLAEEVDSEKLIAKAEDGQSDADSDSQGSTVGEPSEDEPQHEPCQQQSGWCSHMDLAAAWVSALVAEKKPHDKFSGRQKSDMEAMIRWEMRSLETPAIKPGRRTPYSSTLSQHFPSLSGQSWRANASREYTDWKGMQTAARRRDGTAADTWWDSADKVARNEFYKRLYAHCQDAV
ncbi:ankyrin repeat domain protein [Colletotrichum musicola]|uniref:Ankyrin repeat domain protein n=1 Tax=Colletotrichum musicola TaxID=2175873 RepID=A0A8H6MMV5_9PEZI|nr:ankyrin repeat domain protein [Colletotrichum musicola]